MKTLLIENLYKQVPTKMKLEPALEQNFLKIGAGAKAITLVSAPQHWFLL
jgi:hypothetical protein